MISGACVRERTRYAFQADEEIVVAEYGVDAERRAKSAEKARAFRQHPRVVVEEIARDDDRVRAQAVDALDERCEAPALEAVADVQIGKVGDAQAAQLRRESRDLDARPGHLHEVAFDVEAPDHRGTDAECRRQGAGPEQRETGVRRDSRDGEQRGERGERRGGRHHRPRQRDQHEAEREERSLDAARHGIVARGDGEARHAPGSDGADAESRAGERRDGNRIGTGAHGDQPRHEQRSGHAGREAEKEHEALEDLDAKDVAQQDCFRLSQAITWLRRRGPPVGVSIGTIAAWLKPARDPSALARPSSPRKAPRRRSIREVRWLPLLRIRVRLRRGALSWAVAIAIVQAAAAAVAIEADWFPLEAGNRWVYDVHRDHSYQPANDSIDRSFHTGRSTQIAESVTGQPPGVFLVQDVTVLRGTEGGSPETTVATRLLSFNSRLAPARRERSAAALASHRGGLRTAAATAPDDDGGRDLGGRHLPRRRSSNRLAG